MRDDSGGPAVTDPARLGRWNVFGAAAVIAVCAYFWLEYWRSSRSGWAPLAVLRGDGYERPLAFTPDGKSFATSGTRGVTLRNPATGEVRAVWAHSPGSYAAMGAFSPDGRAFAAVHLQGFGKPLLVELRDVAGGRVTWSLEARGQAVYAILFTENGRRVRVILTVGGSNADEVIDIDAAFGQEIMRRTFAVPGGGFSAVSPDGRLMARGRGTSPSITLWNLETNREHAALLIPEGAPAFSSCGFAPDGVTLGVGLSDGSIELWDIKTAKLRATIPGHKPGVHSDGLQFSLDGKTLASYGVPASSGSILQKLGRALRQGPDQTSEVVVIDVVTGKRLGQVHFASGPLFSPDGRTLAVRDASFAIRLFDLRAAPVEP